MGLKGKVAVVAGATRGAGRGIALALGEAGAKVWCVGRSSRANRVKERGGPFELAQRPETVEDTADRCGGVPVIADLTDEAAVQALFERVGAFDVLVNDVWGGDALAEWGKPFWEQTPKKGFEMVDRVLRSHVLCAKYGAPRLRDGARKDEPFAFSETPLYVGRAVAALAADPNVRALSLIHI